MDGVEKCNQYIIEQYLDLMHAALSCFPRPPPPKSFLKVAWRRIAPCCVDDKLVDWFSTEEGEKLHIMWSFVWRDFVQAKGRGSRSVKVMRMRLAIKESLVTQGKMVPPERVGGEGSRVGVGDRLDMMDDAEPVGGEGSEVGIGDWLMDDDLAAEVVSISSSSQCSPDEYPLQPALVQALLDTPGSVPHPAAHREVCRTPKAGKTSKVGSSTKKAKCASKARASAKPQDDSAC